MWLWLGYGASVAAYVVIGFFFTKGLMNWNRSLLYFLVTLDLLPRLVRHLFAQRSHADEGAGR